MRNLKGKPPVSDLFGASGRRWLAAQDLPADQQETVAACLRQIGFLDGEIGLVERTLAEQVLASAEMRRLLTLPGVNFVTAAALIVAIGEVGRFPTARHLVSSWGAETRPGFRCAPAGVAFPSSEAAPCLCRCSTSLSVECWR